jgi:hypothetical protein
LDDAELPKRRSETLDPKNRNRKNGVVIGWRARSGPQQYHWACRNSRRASIEVEYDWSRLRNTRFREDGFGTSELGLLVLAATLAFVRGLVVMATACGRLCSAGGSHATAGTLDIREKRSHRNQN